MLESRLELGERLISGIAARNGCRLQVPCKRRVEQELNVRLPREVHRHLSDVLMEMNRYRRRHIVAVGDGLNGRRISGVFRIDELKRGVESIGLRRTLDSKAPRAQRETARRAVPVAVANAVADGLPQRAKGHLRLAVPGQRAQAARSAVRPGVTIPRAPAPHAPRDS